MSARTRLWREWTLATAVGELVGFAIPAGVGSVMGAAGASELVMAAGLVVAGAGEGAALGYAQGTALRRHLGAGFSRGAFTAATAGAASFAWALGMTPSSVMGGVPPAWPAWVWVVGGVAFGAAFLLVMGTAQWLVLRRHVAGAWRWIPINALAWPLGVAIPVLALTAVPDGAPMWVHAIVGVIAGVAMGVVVGAITGATLVRLVAGRRG